VIGKREGAPDSLPAILRKRKNRYIAFSLIAGTVRKYFLKK